MAFSCLKRKTAASPIDEEYFLPEQTATKRTTPDTEQRHNNANKTTPDTEQRHNNANKTTPNTEPVPEKKFDQSEFKAFRSILGDKFSKTFNVKDTYTDDMVTVYAKDTPLFSDAKGYFENFRKDEMNLSENEMTQLMNSFDEKSFLPNAFAVPVRNQSKVTIYSFRYDEFTKIKHQIEIKCGRKIVTTKDKSKQFENAINLESSSLHVSPTHSYVEGGIRDFTAKSGIKVSVYKADITQLMVDAIVNAANEHLQHWGGVAAAIAKAAGVEMEIEGDDYVKKHGRLNVTDVLPTTAGLLKCRKVFHAVGPRWRDYQDKCLCQELLDKTVFNCLKKAQDLQFTSIAMSSISSAIFGVPKELCARMYLEALQRFEQEYGSESKVRHIHFVDISDEMVSIIQDTFSRLWDTDITLTKGIAVPDPPAFLQTNEVLDLGLTIHTNDKRYEIDAVIYCNDQNSSSGCENEKQKDKFSNAGGLLFFLDLKKIRQNIKGKVLQTIAIDKGTRIVFPAMSRDLTSEEDMRAITERFISKMDTEHTKALTVLIIPYQREASRIKTDLSTNCSGGMLTSHREEDEEKKKCKTENKSIIHTNSPEVVAEPLDTFTAPSLEPEETMEGKIDIRGSSQDMAELNIITPPHESAVQDSNTHENLKSGCNQPDSQTAIPNDKTLESLVENHSSNHEKFLDRTVKNEFSDKVGNNDSMRQDKMENDNKMEKDKNLRPNKVENIVSVRREKVDNDDSARRDKLEKEFVKINSETVTTRL